MSLFKHMEKMGKMPRRRMAEGGYAENDDAVEDMRTRSEGYSGPILHGPTEQEETPPDSHEQLEMQNEAYLDDAAEGRYREDRQVRQGHAHGGIVHPLFHHMEKMGKMPKPMADGGMVNYDEEMGDADEFDSAGEPGTEGFHEDEHPMTYKAKGGRVRGPHPAFVRAISRQR